MHLIRRSKAPTFEEALKESLRQIKGGFTFAILTKDALYGAVDPNAIRPLVVGKMQDDTYILASETCAIDVLGAEYVQDIHAGEYVVINNEGIEVKSYTSHTNTAISAMEYIYFARPDSTIAGKMFMLFVKHLEKFSTRKPCKCRYGYWCTQLIIISCKWVC